MKLDTSYECLNKKCGTYIFGTGKYLDGLNCPRCNGPVVPKFLEKQESKNIGMMREEIKLFDKEIANKKELFEVMEALDKLDKKYVITKSKRDVREMHYEIPVWHVKEISD